MFADVELFILRDADELLVERPDLPGGLRVNAKLPAPAEIVAVPVGVAPGAHQYKEIARGLAAKQILAGVTDLPAFAAREQGPALCERGDQRDLPDTAEFRRRQ